MLNGRIHLEETICSIVERETGASCDPLDDLFDLCYGDHDLRRCVLDAVENEYHLYIPTESISTVSDICDRISKWVRE